MEELFTILQGRARDAEKRPLGPSPEVAMKWTDGHVARRSRIDLEMLPPRPVRLGRLADDPAAHFDRNKLPLISGTGH